MVKKSEASEVPALNSLLDFIDTEAQELGSLRNVAKAMDVPFATLQRYMARKSVPDVERMERMLGYFGHSLMLRPLCRPRKGK